MPTQRATDWDSDSDRQALLDRLRAGEPACWGLALGGTRRAYIAQGGTLAEPADLEDYFRWVEAEQRRLLDRIYGFGVDTIIVIGRLAPERGSIYQGFSRRAIETVVDGPERRELYARRGLRVSVAGDLQALEAATGAAALAERCLALRAATAGGQGGRLVYLFRGAWADASEEASWGYRVGAELGRAPTRDELVKAFYGMEVPPLSVYIGSGRPQLGRLRPPFLGGAEDCYWAANCPIRLADADWYRLIADHLEARRTQSGRSYPNDDAGRDLLARALAANDGKIVGIGYRHALGFWLPK